MRFLKLDARFEDARRIARCLVGSVADESWHKEITEDPKLAYIDDGYFVILFWDVTGMDFEIKHTILLPLDTLKFCPFVAMREGVSVHLKNNQNDVFGDVSCIQDTKLLGCLICIDGENYILDDVTLNIAPIERGELEGCEIVEVGE